MSCTCVWRSITYLLGAFIFVWEIRCLDSFENAFCFIVFMYLLWITAITLTFLYDLTNCEYEYMVEKVYFLCLLNKTCIFLVNWWSLLWKKVEIKLLLDRFECKSSFPKHCLSLYFYRRCRRVITFLIIFCYDLLTAAAFFMVLNAKNIVKLMFFYP